jgi:hypothetical protein
MPEVKGNVPSTSNNLFIEPNNVKTKIQDN